MKVVMGMRRSRNDRAVPSLRKLSACIVRLLSGPSYSFRAAEPFAVRRRRAKMASAASANPQPATAPDEEQPVDAEGAEDASDPPSGDGSTDLPGMPASTPASGAATGNSTTFAAASCRKAAS